MSDTNRKSKRGRPLKGDLKRIRTSFTLPPDEISWLEEQASLLKITKSEFLSLMLQEARYYKADMSTLIQSRFPISKKTLRRFCEKYHITKLALFGSVLTDKYSPESDIDLLVEFDPEHIPSLFNIAGMEHELSKLIGNRKVDIRTPQGLSRYFRDDVIREAEVLYAA